MDLFERAKDMKRNIELKKELKSELLKKGFSNSQSDYIIILIENFSNSESQKERDLFTLNLFRDSLKKSCNDDVMTMFYFENAVKLYEKTFE